MLELIICFLIAAIFYVVSIFLCLYIKDKIDDIKSNRYVRSQVKLATIRDETHGKASNLIEQIEAMTSVIRYEVSMPSFDEEIFVTFPCKFMAEVEAKLINYGFEFEEPDISETIKITAKRTV